MKTLTVSALNTFLTCRRKFQYTYVERLPRDLGDSGSRFVFSETLHAALADFHSRGTIEWGDLDAALLRQWDASLFPDIHASATSYHRARWMLWDSFEAIVAPGIVRFDYSFDLAFGGGKFKGRIDRIDSVDDELILYEYTLSDRIDQQGLRVIAAITAKAFGKPVREIRAIRLGVGVESFEADAASTVEGDVARLRRAIEGERRYDPEPGEHCRFCAYAQICDAAYSPAGTRAGRSNELFRLFAAMEILMNAGQDESSFHHALDSAVGRIDPDGAIIRLTNTTLSDELRRVMETSTETLGCVTIENGAAAIAPASSLIVPFSRDSLVVFSLDVSRMAAELFGRTLRIATSRAASFRAATFDGLTGLFRREVCEERLRSEAGVSFAFVLCDIDKFKSINDRFGHAAGDSALKIVSAILRSRSDAVAYRMGGEEFLVLVPDDSVSYAETIAETLRREIECAEFLHDGVRIPLTASFGVALEKNGENRFDALKRADEALYQAKEQGRNRVILSE